MEDNKYYVYLHIKETTGEPFYVGRGQKYRYNQKRSRSIFWKNIVDKYGFDVIFLETNLTLNEANEKEIYWINRIGRRDLGNGPLVNHTDGGDGASKGNKAWNKGKKLSDEHKLNLSKSHIGQISNMKGKHHSNETKTKISLSKKKYLKNKCEICFKEFEYKDNRQKTCSIKCLSELRSKYKINKIPYNSILILNIETGIYYDSISNASRTINCSRRWLSMMLNGEYKNKTAFIYA